MKEDRWKRLHAVQLHLYEMSRKGKYRETEGRLVVASGCEWEQEVLQMGKKRLAKWWKCSKIGLWWWSQLCKFTKSHWTVDLKRGNFIICKWYLNEAFLKKKIQFWGSNEMINWRPLGYDDTLYMCALSLEFSKLEVHCSLRTNSNAQQILLGGAVAPAW